jgi:hypothetical protein
MRILLDTNVWRYIVDAGAMQEVRKVSQKNGKRILVAPSTVYETLRMSDSDLRNKVISFMSDKAWIRLMPEAFSECEELKNEIRRIRPEWLRRRPDLVMYKRLRFDWRRSNGGFWSRVLAMPEDELAALNALGDAETLDQARRASVRSREHALTLSQKEGSVRLNKVRGRDTGVLPGWDGDDIDFWRLTSRSIFKKLFEEYVLRGFRHGYLDWLEGEVDIASVLADPVSFNRFWLYDSEVEALPRFWLRGAFDFLQVWHKVSEGTPCDSQLGTYLPEADLVISADKNFIRFVTRCYDEGPIRVAQGYRIQGGSEGVEDLLALLSKTSTSS